MGRERFSFIRRKFVHEEMITSSVLGSFFAQSYQPAWSHTSSMSFETQPAASPATMKTKAVQKANSRHH